jgi:hypothetical protein
MTAALVVTAAGALVATALMVTRTGRGAGNDVDSGAASVSPTARRGPAPPEKVTTRTAGLNRQLEADATKPRFEGTLGGFVITTEDADFQKSLPREVAFGGPHNPIPLLPTELNLPETFEQGVCADGQTVVVSHSVVGRRSFFVGAPVAVLDAPRERLEIVDIDGRTGLLVVPPTPVPSPPFLLFVVQRPPAANSPGILLTVASRVGRDDVIDRARAALSP